MGTHVFVVLFGMFVSAVVSQLESGREVEGFLTGQLDLFLVLKLKKPLG